MNIQKLSLVKKSIIGLVGLIVFFVFILWLINLEVFDEAPSAGVQSVVQPHQMPASNENGFIYLFGMNTANEREPTESGKKLISRIMTNREKRGSDNLLETDYLEILGGKHFDKGWTEPFERCRSRTEYGCLQKLTEQIKTYTGDEARLEVMSARYQTLLGFKTYVTANKPSVTTPIASYAPAMTLQQITAAELYHNKDYDGFTHQIIKDIKFWRMLLSGRNMLIDKMVAIAALWNDIQYISEGLRNNIFDQTQKALLTQSLANLSLDEWDISESFELEAQSLYFMLEGLRDLPESGSWLNFSLLQPNATKNFHYDKYLKPIMKLSKLNSYDFYRELMKRPQAYNDSLDLGLSPSNLYNLGGKMLLTNSGWALTSYISRVHDLNGMISLVRLQMEIEKSPNQSTKVIVENSTIRNPYQDKPMDYDPEENWLGFDCMNKESSCRIKL
ncbi:MAG: hypothetical protein OQK04_07245 [Kangiellaceae bacterium]|nr:hypothetical protein [Kangiellaceae bacterium]MCW8998494.1 hypothetical protein [Kangiellaceae bacterium]